MAIGAKRTNFTVEEAAEHCGKKIAEAHSAGTRYSEAIILCERTSQDALGKAIRRFLNSTGHSHITKFNVSPDAGPYSWVISWPVK